MHTHARTHSLPKMSETGGQKRQGMKVDGTYTRRVPRLPECHTLARNRKNPEMILPVLPCLLHANWRLMEEMDRIDRLPSSQFSAAKRLYLTDDERWILPILHLKSFTYEELHVPSNEGGKKSCSY